MNRRVLTFVLLAIFIVVVMAAFAVDSLRRQRAVASLTVADVQPYLFPAVETTDVTAITLVNNTTGLRLTLTKIPGGWRGVDGSGDEVSVNFTRIPQILQLLAILRYNRVLQATEQELVTYGLTEPGLFTVDFTAARRSYRLIVGGVNPSKTSSYVQLDPKGSVYMTDYNNIGLLVNLVDANAPTAQPTGEQSTTPVNVGQGTAMPSAIPVTPLYTSTAERITVANEFAAP